LSNILLTNGNSGFNYGGAVYVNHGRLVLDHATIQNSHTANFSGGAIYADGGEVVVQNHSIVQGNYDYDYGAINSTGGVTIENSILRNNTAMAGGGALSVGGRTIIGNSQITGNTVQGGNGGGLLLTSSAYLEMSDSLVASNLATGTASSSGGGIYSLARINLTRVTLSGNRTVSTGGGLYAGYVTNVQDSTLDGNTTTSFSGGGGGIYSQSSLNLIDVTLSGNHAGRDGGGLLNGDIPGASVVLIKTTLSGNAAESNGGGMSNRNGATILQSVFVSNTASDGGGLNNDGIALVQYAAFDGNTALSVGGGIYNNASLDINNTTFAHNTASQGAGLFNTVNGRALLTNATLSGNAARSYGGGIFNADRVSLLNVTLSDNAAGVSGGALYNSATNGTALTNTIVANSRSGGNCAGNNGIVGAKYSIDSDNTCGLLVGPLGPGNLHAGPKLSALGNYGGPPLGADNRATLVHMPETGSPAIDGVAGDDAPTDDQRGFRRPQNGGQGGGYDIGAVERQPSDVDAIPRVWLPLTVR
jgi:hypothetical protein